VPGAASIFASLMFLVLGASGVAATPARSLPAGGNSTPFSPGANPTTRAEVAGYIGDQACVSCHQDKVASYHRTAHSITSTLPDADSIHGDFNPGANILKTLNTNLYFVMEARDEGFFQTAFLRRSQTEIVRRTEKFGVVVGSGRKGQTYLFWKGDGLFQLPVSYWTELNEWANSPGYPDGSALFSRPVNPRCLECHATFFKEIGPLENNFDKASLVLGITCEKCHGRGAEHQARYQSKTPPQSATNGAVINPGRFARDRQIDVCALCHAGGNPRKSVPSLSFAPGDVLEHYVDLPEPAPNTPVDVHGGTVQLLKRSRCFKSSATMTCSTCHDVHAPQRDLAAFVPKCLGCHKVESCGKFAKMGHQIDAQCVVCHMPLQPTQQIISSANGTKLQPKVRNHQIAIYPEAQLQ